MLVISASSSGASSAQFCASSRRLACGTVQKPWFFQGGKLSKLRCVLLLRRVLVGKLDWKIDADVQGQKSALNAKVSWPVARMQQTNTKRKQCKSWREPNALQRWCTPAKRNNPCAGAMLIFSVSFQFYRMIQKNIKVQFNSQESINIAEKSKKKMLSSKKNLRRIIKKKTQKKHDAYCQKVYIQDTHNPYISYIYPIRSYQILSDPIDIHFFASIMDRSGGSTKPVSTEQAVLGAWCLVQRRE